MDFPVWSYPALFATGLAAGLVDTVAGGGGLISLPVLLNFNVSPQMALGTNKFQSSFGSSSATWHYARAKVVSLRDCVTGILFTLVGSALGAYAVQQLDPAFLRKLIPILLIVLALFMLVRPRIGMKDTAPKLKPTPFYVIFGLLLGFYDGFFGPGVGTFWAISLVLALGFNLVKATGYTKALNFTSNIVSLVVFAIGGQINYTLGLTMGAGQLAGAWLGARLVIKRGAKFIRPVFITMVLALTAKLIYDNFAR